MITSKRIGHCTEFVFTCDNPGCANHAALRTAPRTTGTRQTAPMVAESEGWHTGVGLCMCPACWGSVSTRAGRDVKEQILGAEYGRTMNRRHK